MKSLATCLRTVIQLSLILHMACLPLCASASFLTLSSIQPSDKDAADNPMNLAKRSVDGAINYGDGKTTSLDDDLADADDDDMIDYIRAKQRHCVNVCATVAAKFGSSIDIATCAFHYCATSSLASSAPSAVPSPTKRWGSRLCMEIHCRSLEHDISSYVNCGVRHCTK